MADAATQAQRDKLAALLKPGEVVRMTETRKLAIGGLHTREFAADATFRVIEAGVEEGTIPLEPAKKYVRSGQAVPVHARSAPAAPTPPGKPEAATGGQETGGEEGSDDEELDDVEDDENGEEVGATDHAPVSEPEPPPAEEEEGIRPAPAAKTAPPKKRK